MKKKDLELEIFSRHLILKEFNEKNFNVLQKQNISMIGIGGIGCVAAQYLVSAGIKNLNIIDYDKINLSNLNRQILFSIKDIGQSKGKIAKKRLLAINPGCKIKYKSTRLSEKNIDAILKNSSIVIDSTDNWETMLLINKYCVNKSIPLVSASVIGFDSQVTLFNNKKNKHLCLQCIFPNNTEPDISRCEKVGVIGTASGIAGLVTAQKVLNYFLSKKSDNDMIMIDIKSLKISSLKLISNKKCQYFDKKY